MSPIRRTCPYNISTVSSAFPTKTFLLIISYLVLPDTSSHIGHDPDLYIVTDEQILATSVELRGPPILVLRNV